MTLHKLEPSIRLVYFTMHCYTVDLPRVHIGEMTPLR